MNSCIHTCSYGNTWWNSGSPCSAQVWNGSSSRQRSPSGWTGPSLQTCSSAFSLIFSIIFQGSLPVWIFFVSWTCLLVVVKFHVLVQSLEHTSAGVHFRIWSTWIWFSVRTKPVKLAIFLSIPSWSRFRSSYLSNICSFQRSVEYFFYQ